MIKEASHSKLKELIALRKTNPNLILVNVSCDICTKPKTAYNYQFPALCPEQFVDYKAKLEKMLAIADTMRAWGPTLEDKYAHGAFKAFVDSYGRNAIWYRRHLGADDCAAQAMSLLSVLVKQGKDVVLMSEAESVPDHRFILMRLLGPWRDMRSMMKQLKYSSKYYAEFAKTLEEGRPY